MPVFEHGKSYPIATLPDDLHNETIPNRDRWAIRDALFWNDCQGWWMEHVSDMIRTIHYGKVAATHWSPLPPDPMTREQILAQRAMAICPGCDWAIDPAGEHDCRPSTNLIEQRLLQRRADSVAAYLKKTRLVEEVPGVSDDERWFLWHQGRLDQYFSTQKQGEEYCRDNGIKIDAFMFHEP